MRGTNELNIHKLWIKIYNSNIDKETRYKEKAGLKKVYVSHLDEIIGGVKYYNDCISKNKTYEYEIVEYNNMPEAALKIVEINHPYFKHSNEIVAREAQELGVYGNQYRFNYNVEDVKHFIMDKVGYSSTAELKRRTYAINCVNKLSALGFRNEAIKLAKSINNSSVVATFKYTEEIYKALNIHSLYEQYLDNQPTKQCRLCLEHKPRAEFYRSSTHCNECSNDRKREVYRTNFNKTTTIDMSKISLNTINKAVENIKNTDSETDYSDVSVEILSSNIDSFINMVQFSNLLGLSAKGKVEATKELTRLEKYIKNIKSSIK